MGLSVLNELLSEGRGTLSPLTIEQYELRHTGIDLLVKMYNVVPPSLVDRKRF